MLCVFGTIALDTTRTPFRTETRILGGAATFASLSSSIFTPTGIVAVVGSDLPNGHLEALSSRGIDTSGIVVRQDGKTFHYDSSFDYDLSKRTTNLTELNVVADFEPKIPEAYAASEFVYLANNDPKQNIKILGFFDSPEFVVCDTIEFWINGSRDDVIKMMSLANGAIINDLEARLLCKQNNLSKCARRILSWGPEFVVIKKGENGAILFDKEGRVFPASAYYLDDIADPTGAGDSFAGGFMGHIARRNDRSYATLREAVIYGNVLGSFSVEEFGVKRLLSLSLDDVEHRFEQYRRLVQF